MVFPLRTLGPVQGNYESRIGGRVTDLRAHKENLIDAAQDAIDTRAIIKSYRNAFDRLDRATRGSDGKLPFDGSIRNAASGIDQLMSIALPTDILNNTYFHFASAFAQQRDFDQWYAETRPLTLASIDVTFDGLRAVDLANPSGPVEHAALRLLEVDRWAREHHELPTKDIVGYYADAVADSFMAYANADLRDRLSVLVAHPRIMPSDFLRPQ